MIVFNEGACVDNLHTLDYNVVGAELPVTYAQVSQAACASMQMVGR
jgi:hypothetical protein